MSKFKLGLNRDFLSASTVSNKSSKPGEQFKKRQLVGDFNVTVP